MKSDEVRKHYNKSIEIQERIRKPAVQVEGENTELAQALRWVDEETSQKLFGIEDIVRFDWDQQIFELTRQSAMDLLANLKGLGQKFTVADNTAVIYQGTFVNPVASMTFHGPIIMMPFPDETSTQPPLFRIQDGYHSPSKEPEPDLRFSKRLKKSLQQANVLSEIDVNNPPAPIEKDSHGWFGKKSGLRAWVDVFPETFRPGEIARRHLHIIGAENLGNQADILEVNVNLSANNGKFKHSFRQAFSINRNKRRDIYILEILPWSNARNYYAKAGPAEISMEIYATETNSNKIGHLSIKPIPVMILPEEKNAVQVEGRLPKAVPDETDIIKERIERDPIVVKIRKSLTQLEVALARLLATHGEDHPEVRQTRDELKQAKADLEKRIAHIGSLAKKHIFAPEKRVTPDVQVEGEAELPPDGDELTKKYEGKTIGQWISQWDENDFKRNQKAKRALAAIGSPAVPALIRLIEEGHRHSRQAFQTLGDMGPAAENALPVLIKIARDKNATDPKDWTWNRPMRRKVFTGLGKMTWASDRLIPVFTAIAQDHDDDTEVRKSAVVSLAKMGKTAIPVLETIADYEQFEIRLYARIALGRLLETEQILTRKKYLTQLIEQDPFDSTMPMLLVVGRGGSINQGRPDPLIQKVKKLYHQRLAKEPVPQLAWQLATIIQTGLTGTALEWAAPTDRGGAQNSRQDPAESHITLAEVLELGFAHSKPNSQLWNKFGTGLAKLRLLQGDWNSMNEMLKQLGQARIPAESRPLLAAPPVDWEKDLHKRWTIADNSMRSGNCGLEFRIEKDGKGLKGVHFLVKNPPNPEWKYRTGIRTDTLFLAPQPIAIFETFGGPLESFGYMAKDRPSTRYAVSDESGMVRFDKLPKIPIKIEVLVPTANFPEAGSSWDLWMEVEPGNFKIAKIYGGANAVSWRKPPAVVELKEGKTVYYPKLVVRPAFGMNIKDLQKVNKDNFELSWQGLDTTHRENIHYELEMILSAPGSINQINENRPVVRSAKQIVETNHWPVGIKGVGGLHLQPGNIYMFEVKAIDNSGTVVARWPRTRAWVIWDYRQTEPPFTGSDTYNHPPIHEGMWWKGSHGYGNGRKETLREKVARFLKESPDTFEFDYVRLGKAWLDWHDGKHEETRKQLKQLIEKLPSGNLVRGTAISLLQQINEGKPFTKSLNFVPDRDTNSSKIR